MTTPPEPTLKNNAVAIIRGFRKFMRQHQAAFEAADDILATVTNVSLANSGPVGVALAGASVLGQVMNVIDREPYSWTEYMRQLGLLDKEMSGTEEFLSALLMNADLPRECITLGSGTDQQLVYLWHDVDGAVITGTAYGVNGAHLGGPWVAPHVELGDILADTVWTEHREFTLTTTGIAVGNAPGSAATVAGGSFRLVPAEGFRPYLRKRQPAWYVEQIKRYPPGPRTVVLRGSSGSGKSVLARHIANGIHPEGRTLQVPSSTVRKFSNRMLRGIVQAIRPAVLLLDDMSLGRMADQEGLLELLEALRDPNCLTVITMMTNRPDDAPYPGIYYIDGMRPGRVDKVWSITLPDAEETANILALYLGGRPTELPAIAAAVQGLPGAFLAHLAEELLIRLDEPWQDVVQEVLWAAPARGRADPRAAAPPAVFENAGVFDPEDEDDGTERED